MTIDERATRDVEETLGRAKGFFYLIPERYGEIEAQITAKLRDAYAEIERLTKELQDAHAEIVRLRAENQKLTGVLETAREASHLWQEETYLRIRERDELRSEIARLRAKSAAGG